MQRVNLSEWAITHRALVLFMIILLGAAGVYSYFNLGRAEDPSFTIKTMVCVAWPGATATEMQTQVADKIEKKLQELPHLDQVETYTQPGVSFIQVITHGHDPAGQGQGALVPGAQEDRRHPRRPARRDHGPNFNDEYGDVYSALYMLTADGLSLAELKARAEDIRQRLLRVPTSTRSTSSACGRRRSSSSSAMPSSRRSGVTPQQIFDSVARQNAVVSGGSVDTSADRINLRVTGAFTGVAAIAAVPVEANGRVFRLGDIATVKRGYEDPPSIIVRDGGKPALGLGVAMQEGANILTLGENLKRR